MKKTIFAVLSAMILLLGAIPAWAVPQPTQPGPVSTFGFNDARDRDVSPAIASYEMWPAWQDSFGESYSQPLIINGTSDGTPATYIVAVGGGTAPQIAVWKNIQAQPSGQYQSNAPIWAHPIEGRQPTTSHPSLYDINGHDIVFVGTEPGASGDSYIDGFDVTGILDGTSTQGSMVLDAPDPNASDIVSAPLLMNYQGHLVLVYTDGNSGRIGLMYGIDGLAKGQTISTQQVSYLDPGGRTSSSPAPVMNGTAFAVGVDTGGNPGAVYVYRLQDLFVVQGGNPAWSNSPGAYAKFGTDAGVDASFSVDPSNSNVMYFADSRSNIYSANLSTKQYNWENSDVPNSIGSPGDFSNRSPAFGNGTVYVPVGTKPGLTQSGVIAVSGSTGATQWVSQYSSAYTETDPNDMQIGGINPDGSADPTNAQTAPVIMPCTEWGDPLIVEGLGDDQVGFIDSQTGVESMTAGPQPIQNVSPGYATGITGEVSIGTDNSPGAVNGVMAYTTQNGIDVWDFTPTDVSIGNLTITDSTGKTLAPNAQGIYSVLAGQKYTVAATVTYNQSPSGDPTDTSWPLANVPVDGFVNTGGTLPKGTWIPQGTATTTGSQPTGGTWYPVSQLDNGSGTAISPTQVTQLNNPMTQMMDPTVSLQAQGNTSTVEFSWTPSASDVSSTNPYAFIGMITNENFPAGDNPPLVQAYPDIPLYNNSIEVPVDVEAPALVVSPANATIQVGGTQDYTDTYYPTGVANGGGQAVTTDSAWSSSDTTNAPISYSSGVASGKGVTTATITAQYAGITGTASLTVLPNLSESQTNGNGLTFTATGQDGTQRTSGTAKWTDTVDATLTPLHTQGTVESGSSVDYSTTVAPPAPPTPPPGAPGPNYSVMGNWSFDSATLNYPTQNPDYSFGNPLPPSGTSSVTMTPDGQKMTASFKEMWAEDGTKLYDLVTQEMLGPPAEYTLTASGIDVTVPYVTYMWRLVGGKPPHWELFSQPGSYTQELSPIDGQLLVNGTGAVGLGNGGPAGM